MAKFMDKIYGGFSWIIIALAMFAYFFFQTMEFQGDIENILTEPKQIFHLIFVVFLSVMVVSTANDSGFSVGLLSDEFDLADKVNNKIIQEVNNNMSEFRGYVKSLNDHELKLVQEDYLFSVGDKKVEELTKKELKKYKKLKAIQHDIYGFNLPLHFTISRNKKVQYAASYDKNKGKRWAMVKKVLTGLMFGGMTVNMVFNWSGAGEAFISLLIISAGLLMTFITQFIKPMFKLKYELPKKVIFKTTLWNSFKDYKLGNVVLKNDKIPEIEDKIEEHNTKEH